MANPSAPAASAEPMPVRRRFCIIRNRHAGLVSARLVARVIDELGKRDGTIELVETQSASDLHRVLDAAGDADAIVAAGGDGTIRSLALAMLDAGVDKPLGIIPAGTGNVLANEVGLKRIPSDLVEVLLRAPARPVAFKQANEALFILMASAGFDAAALTRLSHPFKQRVGRAAYSLPTLSAFAAERARPFNVRLDDRDFSATWAIVANARTYGGSFRLAPDASIFEDTLHAVLFHATTHAGRLRELLYLAAGRAGRCPSVEIVPCQRAVLHCAADLPVQADGDLIGHGPITIGPDDRSIRIIVPPARDRADRAVGSDGLLR
ncbi:MAG: hypothetical protein KDJ47_02340 [Hyphomicrobiaceae bacterium]|nr:hypothetical protein [Hyphomicrobiaceae bacterium]